MNPIKKKKKEAKIIMGKRKGNLHGNFSKRGAPTSRRTQETIRERPKRPQ